MVIKSPNGRQFTYLAYYLNPKIIKIWYPLSRIDYLINFIYSEKDARLAKPEEVRKYTSKEWLFCKFERTIYKNNQVLT